MLGGWLLTTPAAAQVPPQKMAADAAFDQGKTLMGAGQFTEACSRFAESQRLDPASSTLLWLGECLEKSGKLASAWTTYREAASLAAQQGKAAREKDARERVASLEPRVPQVQLRGELSAPGLVVQLDGVALGAALWRSPLPLDAGPHTLALSAPGRAARTLSVQVTPDRGPQPIDVPALEESAKPSAPATSVPVATAPVAVAPVTTPGEDRSPRHRTTGLVLGGIGAAVMIGGVALQLSARSSAADSRERHDPDLYDTAQTRQTVAVTAMVAAGALLATGVVLVFYPSRPSTAALQFTPGGARLVGSF